MQSRRSQRGLTLIELMISMALGLALCAAIVALFLQSQRSQRQNAEVQGMQDQARFALQQLSRDLAMAGYWGGLYGGSGITVSPAASAALPPSNDCGPGRASSWAFATERRVEFRNHAEPGTASQRFGCLVDAQPSTDAVAIRRVAGQESARTTNCDRVRLKPQGFYLKTNGTVGTLIRLGVDANYLPCVTDEPLAAPAAFHRFVPRLYYIRSWSQHTGDRVPTLCRRELQHAASAQMADECLAEGAEDLQISWGLDTDGDGVIDRYNAAPSPTEMTRARTAQVFLMMRGRGADPGYFDEKTYTMADHVFEPAALAINAPEREQPVHFMRRVFTTTVQLRNATL